MADEEARPSAPPAVPSFVKTQTELSSSTDELSVMSSQVGNNSLSTAFNLTNGMIGFGILAVPYTFQRGGWLVASIWVFAGVLAAWTSTLIVGCLERASLLVPEPDRKGEPLNWPIIGQAVCGIWGSHLVKAVFLGDLWISIPMMQVVIGDNLHILFPSISPFFIFMACGITTFIMLLIPTKYVRHLSLIGVVTVALVLGSIVTSGLCIPEMPVVSEYALINASAFPAALCAALPSFQIHAGIPWIYTQASAKGRQSYWKASCASFGMGIALYLFVGVAGYLFFASSTQDNLAENISRDVDLQPIPGLEPLRVILAALLVVKMQCCSLPLIAAPLLESLESVLSIRDESKLMAKLILKLVLIASTTLIATLLREKMFALLCFMGALFGTTITVVFPTSFYAILHRKQLTLFRLWLLALVSAGGFYIIVTGTWTYAKELLAMGALRRSAHEAFP